MIAPRLMSGAGLRALAVCYPQEVRTNEHFRARYPAQVEAAAAHAAVKVWEGPAPGAPGSQGAFEHEMAPYLRDPFRGTVERRVLGPGQTALSLEVPAAQRALAAAGVRPDEVDLLISCAFLPDALGVGNAPLLSRALGLRGAAWNLESACAGGLVALQTACGLVQAGQHRRVLVVVSCTYSRAVDDADTLAWNVGDGAGAFLIEEMPAGQGLLGGVTLHTAGTCGAMWYEIAGAPGEAPWLRMQAGPGAGRLIRDASEEYVRRCCHGALAAAGVALADVALLVCNTPVAWYAAFCARALGIAPDRVVDTYPRYGNIGPALITANLHHAAASGRLRPGDLVLLYAIGSVSSASAAVLRWGPTGLDLAVSP